MDSPFGPRQTSTIRSFNGCWTCRLRRKKCDEKHPVCDACATLLITCHYAEEKPKWMDGGVRQEETAERLKREIKDKAHRRRGWDRTVHKPDDRFPVADAATDELIVLPPLLPRDLPTPTSNRIKTTLGIHSDGMGPYPGALDIQPQSGTTCTLTSTETRDSIPLEPSDTIFLMFYIEHLLPFLFPFYRPSLLIGGRAWVLEMMISSPVVRQATLCQSSYFFSLARGTNSRGEVWDRVITQTRDAFKVLRQSLQVIEISGVAEHLQGAVQILTSIMQVQRFEIAVLSFDNCQSHLNAALTLFKQLLNSTNIVGPAESSSSFNAVMSQLGPSSWILPLTCPQIPTSEQAAFRFSSTILILDDIIASTVLQEKPRLYEYHYGLLDSGINASDPLINLEAVVGCQNWVLQLIGEIAVLDAWKQNCKRAGNLDVIELVRRATTIKDSLETRLTQLEAEPVVASKDNSTLLDVLATDYSQTSKTPTTLSPLVTRVWAHASLIYLFTIVSGWQPANVEVRYHVNCIVDLLTCQIFPPALLRTMVWPFCVAGCLVEQPREPCLRGMVEALQPPSVFGTVRKALEIMEGVWRSRDVADAVNRDLAACFRSQGDLVLLV